MPRPSHSLARKVALFSCTLLALACQKERRPVYYPTPVATTTAPGAVPAPGPPAAAAPTAAPAPAPAATAAPTTPSVQLPSVPSLPVAFDPINSVDINFLRGRAVAVLGELVANLPAPQRTRVQNIPLITDSTVGEVNAFAACTRDGKTAMAITDGLLDIQAHLAQARAIDEVFGLRKVDEYIRFIAQNQRPKAPIAQPPAGMFDPAQTADSRKVTRQHQVLDEQIAFVLGHELAHHYLGHLPCTAGGGLSGAEVARVLSDVVPIFNQGNEVSADTAGINNTLTTGARRQGYHFTEGGALLTMQFFAGLDQLSPIDILFGFERSHPPPAFRTPWIQQAANVWRSTGGQGLPVIGF
ncbi:MAG: M48 family metalloprotease [Myxococcota bacterium]